MLLYAPRVAPTDAVGDDEKDSDVDGDDDGLVVACVGDEDDVCEERAGLVVPMAAPAFCDCDCVTVGSDADCGFEVVFEFKAWSPNAPTPTPTANSNTGMPTRARALFFRGVSAATAEAAGALAAGFPAVPDAGRVASPCLASPCAGCAGPPLTPATPEAGCDRSTALPCADCAEPPPAPAM